MTNNEKALELVQKCLDDCPYAATRVIDIMKRLEQVKALLKEQEAVVPILIREGRNKNYNDYVCPRCDNEVVYEQNYCSECGVEFMWEGL
jgi:hypothetical protein